MQLVWGVAFAFFLWSIRTYILYALFGLAAWTFGYHQEWWGTPARLVEMHDFRMIEGGNIGEYRSPRITGTLVNNSNNPLSSFSMKVKYYRCPYNNAPTLEVSECNEVWPGSGGYSETISFRIGVAPHSSTFIDINQSLYDLLSVKRQFERDGFFIKYLPYFDYVG